MLLFAKKIFRIILVLTVMITFTACSIYPNKNLSKKHALLIGIGAYEPSTGWASLQSTNDVALLKTVLQKKGFKSIHTLTNKQATRTKILNEIQTSLINKVKKGDLVVFHYSGHGQQVEDKNKDEEDGLDEAIVPYDSPQLFSAGVYEGEKLILDDELGSMFLQLREKLGAAGHLVIIMDACHSGSGVRGLATTRGTNTIMASPDYLEQLSTINKTDKHRMDEVDKEGSHLASMVAIYSSSAEQLSYEITTENNMGYGLLSYAIGKCLNSLEARTSYRGLLDKIKNIVSTTNSLQTPQLEGPLDIPVFGGEKLVPIQYYKPEEYLDSSSIRMEAGTFQGLFKGTKVVLYPIDTRDTTSIKPVATGEITHTQPFASTITLDEPSSLSKKEALNTWIFITEKKYGATSIRLKIDTISKEQQYPFSQQLDAYPFINITDNNPELLLKKQAGKWVLVNQEQRILLQMSEFSFEELIETCEQAALAKYYRAIANTDNRFKADLTIIKKSGPNNDLQVKEEFQLAITNIGSEDFYFAILVIQADNSIIVLDVSSGKQLIKVDTTFLFRGLEADTPTGTDVIKLIAKPKAFTLPTSFNIGTTRSRGNQLRLGTAGIYTLTFNVNEKQNEQTNNK